MIWQKKSARILHSVILKKIVKSEYKEGYLIDLTEFSEIACLQNLQIDLEVVKHMDESFWFLRFIPTKLTFHREWPQLSTIFTSFIHKIKRQTFRQLFDNKRSQIRWKQLGLHKIKLILLEWTTKIRRIHPCIWPPDRWQGLGLIISGKWQKCIEVFSVKS